MKKTLHILMIGVMIGLLSSIIFSSIFGDGHYYPVSPVSTMGQIYLTYLSEPITMLISIIIWGAIGLLFNQTSRIFNETDWSITRMTVTHFVVSYVGLTALAILAGWFPLHIGAFISFTLIFVVIYLIIWSVCKYQSRKMVQNINNQIKQR